MDRTILLRSFAKHHKAERFITSKAKRKIARAGRRGAKTTSVAALAVRRLLEGGRVLYAGPTADQLEAFWYEVTRALRAPCDSGELKKNNSAHYIEVPNTKNRLRAKTAWNADTLRGDYADLLILDEWQMMNETAWTLVGAPMLIDNDGDAVFIYTPPSLETRSVTKADNPLHAALMFKEAMADTTGDWEAFHWTSLDNPFVSESGLARITGDMTNLAYRQEIEAEDMEEATGSLWNRQDIDAARVRQAPDLERIIIGVDPPGGGTECGIVAVGKGVDGDLYVLADVSLRASPDQWAKTVVFLYEELEADRIVGEGNYGGDMVEHVIRSAAQDNQISISFGLVHASRGKAIRAEPISAKYEQGRVHHVGNLSKLEDEMCMWVPGVSARSPNRIDAMVWAATQLINKGEPRVAVVRG